MVQQQESWERLARPLIRLAQLNGVATSYIGQQGEYNEIDDDVIVRVLAALGVDASTPEQIAQSLSSLLEQRRTRIVAGTALAIVGQRASVPVNHPSGTVPQAVLTLEDGTRFGNLDIEPDPDQTAFPSADGEFYVSSKVLIPSTLPVGYHTLSVSAGDQSSTCRLIVAPERVPLLPELQEGQLWGWMAQLYSIRSHGSWGVGDYDDLARIASDAKTKTGADFIQVNPLHAAEPVAPLTPSPYLPDSRRFINFTYIRPEDIEEFGSLDEAGKQSVRDQQASVAALNDDAEHIIDRDAMWKAKVPALWTIFRVPRSPQRQKAFDDYKKSQGAELDGYATWCVCYEVWGAPKDSPDSWVRKYTIDSPEVRSLVASRGEMLEFYRWLEWIATGQLHAAQESARQAGMKVGLMLDMAVGVHPLGSDVWAHPERFAKNVSVGAPPDFFNQQGQDWSQPPFNPRYLEKTGYKAYSDLVHSMFQAAGALRIDHILGLFRLWWVPAGKTAKYGTYVYYDDAVMLGILAVEAMRANGVVVGEDLGVVPDYVAKRLRDHGLLGSVVEWFERDSDGEFIDPSAYREMALASVVTHDMPPDAGYLEYASVTIRERLHLLTEPVEKFKAAQVKEHEALIRFLVKGGWLSQDDAEHEAERTQQVVEAMYRALKAAPSKLLCAAIVDGVGEKRTQNQPGTNNEYPNWRVPLADGDLHPVYAEDLFSLPRVQSLAQIMNA